MRILGFEIRRAADAPAPSGRSRAVWRTAWRKLGFEAGNTDRLTGTWSASDQSDNMALRSKLRAMRARSRDFCRNNEYGRKFLSLVETNVVGHAGFTLKVDCRDRAGNPDKADSRRIAAAYTRWIKAGQFDVTGRLSETMFDRLAIRMVARDGECLIRLVTGRDRGVHGCQLQLLPGHLLDEEHNQDLPNGHRIRMGVEYDPFMAPVAYHLRVLPPNSDMHGITSRVYQRVPAAEIIHVLLPMDAEQWRGVPWAYAALRGAWQLDRFDEAALVAANVGASKMGFFQQKDPEAGPPIGESDDDSDQTGDFVDKAEPGTFEIIPDGYEFKDFSPDFPNAVYEPFHKEVARRMASGLLVGYHGLTGDLRDVNYSSIRQGELTEREAWKVIQSWYIEAVKVRVFGWWLGNALVRDADLKSLPQTQFDKFNAPIFTGRRWDWVDPKSDVMAEREAVALGIRSRQQIIRDRGGDPDQVFRELAEEAAMGLPVAKAGAAKPEEEDPDGAAAGETPPEETDQD